MNPPKKVTLLLSLILAGLGIAANFVSIPFVSAYNFWFVAAGYVLLLLGCLIKGL